MNSGFLYFPEQLHSRVVKIIPKIQKWLGTSRPPEIFYSTKDGNWNDVTIWETVSGRVGKLPSWQDDVYIHNTVTNIGGPYVINNLFVASYATFQSAANMQKITVLGDMKFYGTSGLQTANNGNNQLYLCGSNNFFNRTTQLYALDIVYSGPRDQAILDINYNTLNIALGGDTTYRPICSGRKYLTADVSVITTTNSLSGTTSPCYFDIGSYNFTTAALSILIPVVTFGNGNTILCTSTTTFGGGALFLGTPNVEFRGNVTFQQANPLATGGQIGSTTNFTLGTGPLSFTTNSLSLTMGSNQTFQFDNSTIIVATGITVTNLTSTGIMQINTSLTGASGTGNFTNQGLLHWNNVSSYTYATGVFTITSSTNVIGYIFNGSITLPYSTYQGLYIAGTGTKTAPGAMTIGTTFSMAAGSPIFTAAGNITVGTNWSQLAGSVVNLLTYDLTVTGTTFVSGSTATRFNKTGAGALIFVGALTLRDACIIDMSGNPTIEFRGGFLGYGNNYTNSNFGTGAVSITTNNQSFSTISGGFSLLFGGTLTIASGITFTLNYQASIKCPELTGASGTAAFINKGFLAMSTTATLMSTGTADITTYANFLHYDFDGAHTLPYTTYYHLVVSGTGTKTLSGNTTTLGSFNVGTVTTTALTGWTAPIPSVNGILDLSTYNLTVNGTFIADGTVSENGSGANTHLFIGETYLHTGTFSFTTGNPNFEFRGGMRIYSPVSFGTGTMTFTTNNQSFTSALAGTPLTISSPITISGAITVTVVATPSLNLTLTGTLNGNNAGSTFDNRSQVNYQSATRPMVTGVLQTNAAANTWKYDLAGNQDVTGGTYRILTLAGSGVKTLQGNVVVVTTYTLTAPATLDLNGFTRT